MRLTNASGQAGEMIAAESAVTVAGGAKGAANAVTINAATINAATIKGVTIKGEAATELGQAIYELAARMIDLEEFSVRFLAVRIYTLCPVRPGLFVMSRPRGEVIVPVWSTVRGLRQVMGDYDWCARTGADLVDQLPAGAGVLIDPGMPHAITLPPLAGSRCAHHGLVGAS